MGHNDEVSRSRSAQLQQIRLQHSSCTWGSGNIAEKREQELQKKTEDRKVYCENMSPRGDIIIYIYFLNTHDSSIMWLHRQVPNNDSNNILLVQKEMSHCMAAERRISLSQGYVANWLFNTK